MKAKRTLLGQILCPLVGGLVLTYGCFRQAQIVSDQEIVEATRAVRDSQDDLRELRATPLVSAERLAERLPTQFELGAVIDEVRRHAAACDIQNIRLEVEKARQVLCETAGESVELIPVGNTVSVDQGGAADLGPQVREPETVRCRLDLESSYAALVRFAGQLETMNPLTTIAGLHLVAAKGRIQAELVVDFHYLPSEK